MKKNTLFIILFWVMIADFSAVKAQDVIQKNGYTLTFKSNFAALNPQLKQRLIETFF
ncbi:MAG: secretory protein, partial [Sphingobacteriaceae bacterium]